MIGTSSAIALLTAVPIAPEELSTCSSAGERRSSRVTAPSAASTGSPRATILISLTACFTRWIAGDDLQPKAWRRNRAVNAHLWPPTFIVLGTLSTERNRCSPQIRPTNRTWWECTCSVKESVR
jgi:hypothetical protein